MTLHQRFDKNAAWPLELHSDLLPGPYSVITTHVAGKTVTELDRRDVTVRAGAMTRIELAR